jgi:hypothetical protein
MDMYDAWRQENRNSERNMLKANVEKTFGKSKCRRSDNMKL